MIGSPGVLMIATCFLLLFYGLLLLVCHSRKTWQQKRLGVLEQVQLLRLLTGELYRHRGFSHAVLHGETSLHTALLETRDRLDQLMALTDVSAAEQQPAWLHLMDHWSRLRKGSLNPSDSLQQHHQIIHNSIFLLEDMIEAAMNNHPDMATGLASIWHEILQASEWVGQAQTKGLCLLAGGKNGLEQRIKLRFLYQKIRLATGNGFAALRPYFETHLPDVEASLQGNEQRTNRWLDELERKLLAEQGPEINALDYLQQTSQVIDDLLQLTDLTLQPLQPAQLEINQSPGWVSVTDHQ